MIPQPRQALPKSTPRGRKAKGAKFLREQGTRSTPPGLKQAFPFTKPLDSIGRGGPSKSECIERPAPGIESQGGYANISEFVAVISRMGALPGG